MTLLFYAAAGVAILASLLAVTRSQAMHALLYLVVALFGVALVFLSLGAPLLAALEIIVYAGAIVVLFLFALMFINLGHEAHHRERRWLSPASWILPGLLSAALLTAAIYAVAGTPAAPTAIPSGLPPAGTPVSIGPKAVGVALFTEYAIGVELASILLLAGLVGAQYLARSRALDANVDAEPDGRERWR